CARRQIGACVPSKSGIGSPSTVADSADQPRRSTRRRAWLPPDAHPRGFMGLWVFPPPQQTTGGLMVRKLRPRSAYDVMAAIAFFIAVAGGSAYAAATIGSSDIKNDAVKSNHIKNGQVKNPDLAANSVGTGKVINGSLLKQDFKAGQLPRGAPGPAGPTVSASASSGTSFDVPASNTNTPTAPVQAQIT